MATQLNRDDLDLQEQIARIAKIQEEIDKTRADARKATAEVEYMPRSMIFQAMLATAALLGAGAALAKFSSLDLGHPSKTSDRKEI